MKSIQIIELIKLSQRMGLIKSSQEADFIILNSVLVV